VFRDGDSLVWVMIQGEGGDSIEDSPFSIDAEHAAFAGRCMVLGGEEAEPQLLLLPAPSAAPCSRWAGLPEA
jgi:hypothetical protein